MKPLHQELSQIANTPQYKGKLTQELYSIARFDAPRTPKEQLQRIGLELDSASTSLLYRFEEYHELSKLQQDNYSTDRKIILAKLYLEIKQLIFIL